MLKIERPRCFFTHSMGLIFSHCQVGRGHLRRRGLITFHSSRHTHTGAGKCIFLSLSPRKAGLYTGIMQCHWKCYLVYRSLRLFRMRLARDISTENSTLMLTSYWNYLYQVDVSCGGSSASVTKLHAVKPLNKKKTKLFISWLFLAVTTLRTS